MYGDIFCKVYNEFGWNYYPEIFGEELLLWLQEADIRPRSALDLACGTGVLCRRLRDAGLRVRGMDLSAGMIDIARERCPEIQYDVADMTDYHPGEKFDLVTCTGDALNHLSSLAQVEKTLGCVADCLEEGGWFVFDLLNESEVSDSEPFEMDFTETTRMWFRMTRPAPGRVDLTIRVYESGREVCTQVIRETIHDPAAVCALLEGCGLRVYRCADRMRDSAGHGTTWFLMARKESVE